MRRAHRTDANQADIARALAAIPGASVFDASGVGGGFADLVVGFRGENYLLEVKHRKRKPNLLQLRFAERWQGRYAVIRSLEDALLEIGLDYQG
jgi:hypothetical protein